MSKKLKRIKKHIQNVRDRTRTVLLKTGWVDEIHEFKETYTGPVVYLDRENMDALPFAVCTAGDFQTEPDSNLLALGRAAKAHADESGHRLRKIS